MLSAVGLALHPRLAVSDNELKVAHRRSSEVRVIHLGQLTAVQRVPNLAGQRGGSAKSVPVADGPQGRPPRPPRPTTATRPSRARRHNERRRRYESHEPGDNGGPHEVAPP